MPALTRSSRRWLMLGMQLVVVALVVWGVYRTLLRGWQDVRSGSYPWHFDPGWLIAAGCFNLLGFLPACLFWHRLLRAMGQDARWGETLRAYYVGQPGKYVPGKMMVVLIRVGLIRSHRVDARAATLSIFFETLTMMAAGGFLGAAFLAVQLRQEKLLMAAAVVAMLGMLLPTLPPVFKRAARLAGVGRNDPATAEKLDRLGLCTLLYGWIAMLIGWVLTGLSLWAVLRAMGIAGRGHDLVGQVAWLTGAAAVSKVAGFVALIPAGLGVADITLVKLLPDFIGGVAGSGIPADGAALVAAALLRLVWLLSEVLVSGILYIAGSRPARLGATESVGPQLPGENP